VSKKPVELVIEDGVVKSVEINSVIPNYQSGPFSFVSPDERANDLAKPLITDGVVAVMRNADGSERVLSRADLERPLEDYYRYSFSNSWPKGYVLHATTPRGSQWGHGYSYTCPAFPASSFRDALPTLLDWAHRMRAAPFDEMHPAIREKELKATKSLADMMCPTPAAAAEKSKGAEQ
jgi:hypothetical protein